MATPRLCSVEGCGKPFLARGYCKSHYRRFMNHGDPLAGSASRGVPLQWLRDHVGHEGDECLIWPFGRENGYGAMRVNGSYTAAHRVMCDLAHGPKPTPQHEAAHSCGQGAAGCVTPNHLRWATRSENCNDRTLHGTQNRGERCGNAKLTEYDVRAIRALRGKRAQCDLASDYGVSATAIHSIHNGRTWKWLA